MNGEAGLQIVLTFLLISVLLLSGLQAFCSSSGAVKWTKTYGGTRLEQAWSIVQTSDDGYALAGFTLSYGTGANDFWLVKTDSSGNQLWNKTYGGTGSDLAYSVIQTSDGGYVLAGLTSSYGAGYSDTYLIKVDSAGNQLWDKTYGGADNDGSWSVVQTSDGGYALGGFTGSSGAGYEDFWLIKTDSSGDVLWSKKYGGTDNDGALSVVQTSDGGYALTGYTYSYGAGDADVWLVKVDEYGNVQWNKTYGGTDNDGAFLVVQTADEGYAISGRTASFGSGNFDFWLVKADEYGNLQWNKTYGGAGEERALSVVQTADEGYALAGFTGSSGAGKLDVWLVKTDSAGNQLWNSTCGGTDNDRAQAAVQSNDGGYALAGYTCSYGAGDADFWLVKVQGGASSGSSGFILIKENLVYALTVIVVAGMVLAVTVYLVKRKR